MKRRIPLVVLILATLFAFKSADDTLWQQPSQWPVPVYDFKSNPLTERKIELGRALFYDPLLSRDNTISCASCHSQYVGFTHVDHALSHGIDNKIGTRNTPVLINLAWQKQFMWDGAIHNLDVQALAPIQNKVEMDEDMAHVVLKLQQHKDYPQKYYEAFGDSVITGANTLKALSQFLLTLVSCNAKYDSVMRHQAVFTVQEAHGYVLFKNKCGGCHTEPLFTNNSFENNGLAMDTTLHDYGRYDITHKPQDSLKFKVPTLRNIEFSYPYMHDGRFRNLSQVMAHYTEGIVVSATLDKTLKVPMELSANDKVDIIAFLLTLTDKTFLFDKRFSYSRTFFSASRRMTQ